MNGVFWTFIKLLTVLINVCVMLSIMYVFLLFVTWRVEREWQHKAGTFVERDGGTVFIWNDEIQEMKR